MKTNSNNINSNKANTNKLNYNKDKPTKSFIKIKILIGIFCAIIFATVVLFMVEMLVIGTTSYYSTHFATAVVLGSLGVIIMLLVSMNKSRVVGETKGDGFMEKVAIASFIIAILSIAFSYLSL